jgi:hypothetical protein
MEEGTKTSQFKAKPDEVIFGRRIWIAVGIADSRHLRSRLLTTGPHPPSPSAMFPAGCCGARISETGNVQPRVAHHSSFPLRRVN